MTESCMIEGCANPGEWGLVGGGMLCRAHLEMSLRSPEQRKADARAKKESDRETRKSAAFRGMETERKVQQSLHTLVADTGWRLTKHPTPAHYQRKAIADFNGYTMSGIVLALEVKSTKKDVWSIAVMPEHQIAYLDDVEQCARRAEKDGGSFVLIDFREAGRWFLVPWVALRTNRIAHLTDAWLAPFESDPLAFWRPICR